jgi:hypothetical protein
MPICCIVPELNAGFPANSYTVICMCCCALWSIPRLFKAAAYGVVQIVMRILLQTATGTDHERGTLQQA